VKVHILPDKGAGDRRSSAAAEPHARAARLFTQWSRSVGARFENFRNQQTNEGCASDPQGVRHIRAVIPGRRAAANPESSLSSLDLDSGFSAFGRAPE
jgi:hypothetical protein